MHVELMLTALKRQKPWHDVEVSATDHDQVAADDCLTLPGGHGWNLLEARVVHAESLKPMNTTYFRTSSVFEHLHRRPRAYALSR